MKPPKSVTPLVRKIKTRRGRFPVTLGLIFGVRSPASGEVVPPDLRACALPNSIVKLALNKPWGKTDGKKKKSSEEGQAQ